jgi:hypothetical protein
MNEPAYPLARAAAARIHDHFRRHREPFLALGGPPLAPLADVETVEEMIDSGFWASLQREEGYPPQISLAFVAPEHVDLPLLFERPLDLGAKGLAKVAPAVERPGIHLGVWRVGGRLCTWGGATNLPAYSFVLEVVAPGLLVVKHSRAGSGKYVNIAVLQGDQIKVIDQRAVSPAECFGPLSSLLTLESQSMSSSAVNVLIDLAVSMRAHRRGGSLLVVPAGSDQWRESILSPISYSVAPAFAALADLAQNEYGHNPGDRPPDEIRRAVEIIAGLTAVDGATVITDRYELLAFGVKIVRRPGLTVVSQLMVTEPVEGVEATVVEPAELGGARHLSAAQFTYDQRDATAMVASQDGRFTVFGWSACDDMIRAHRIETLLL